MANVRAMTPALAKQSLGILLGEKSGFYCRALTDSGKYIDASYRDKALAR